MVSEPWGRSLLVQTCRQAERRAENAKPSGCPVPLGWLSQHSRSTIAPPLQGCKVFKSANVLVFGGDLTRSSRRSQSGPAGAMLGFRCGVLRIQDSVRGLSQNGLLLTIHSCSCSCSCSCSYSAQRYSYSYSTRTRPLQSRQGRKVIAHRFIGGYRARLFVSFFPSPVRDEREQDRSFAPNGALKTKREEERRKAPATPPINRWAIFGRP